MATTAILMDFPVIWLSLTVDMPRWYFTSPDPWGGRRSAQVTTNEANKQKCHHLTEYDRQFTDSITVAISQSTSDSSQTVHR